MLEIIYQDEHFVAINKPSGIPVHATKDPSRVHVELLLKEQLKCSSLWPAHRIDKETTGVLLFNLTRLACKYSDTIFKENKISKIYYGLVEGIPEDKTGEWIDYLRPSIVEKKEKMVSVFSGGQKAILNYSVVHSIDFPSPKSLIKFDLKTGRKHQIRVQSALRGHPLVGDQLYGKKSIDPFLLHCYKMDFIHPETKLIVSLVADMPNKLKTYIP